MKILYMLRIWLASKKAKKINKEFKKYPESWTHEERFEYVLKKSKLFMKMFKVKYNVVGEENFPSKPCLVIANHADNIDPVLLLRFIGNLKKRQLPVFISKVELRKGMSKDALELLETLFMDRSNLRQSIEIIDQAAKKIQNDKCSVVIFPEGTRSKDGKLGEFKPGAFKPAYQTLCPIVPISIKNSFDLTNKNSKKGKREITLTIHQPITSKQFIHKPTNKLSEEVKQIIQSGI